MRFGVLAVLLGGGVLGWGCVRTPVVERAYDGHVVQGRFITPEAYAAFLRGAAADAGGDLPEALAAYQEASKLDPGAAETWTRIGEVRCRANPRDKLADASFGRALERDPTYVRAWAAKARCALARGDIGAARDAAQRAVAFDPSADGANVLLANIAPPGSTEAARAMLLALTVTARDPTVGWGALATWAEAHGDVILWARGLEELVRVCPARRDEVARAAERLAGVGEVWEAREVASAVADAESTPLAAEHALAARLAVDEAIARGDAGAVSRRATRVRVPLDEAAARALLSGNRTLARDLASAVVLADPGALGVRLVLAASEEKDLVGAAHEIPGQAKGASAAAFVVFTSALAHASSPKEARTTLSRLAHEPIVAGDDIVVRRAAELAARGALAVDALPPDGLVELAALRGETPGGEPRAPAAPGLDARHEYLALAMGHPGSERARALATRFSTLGAADPIVAAASALMLLAAGSASTATARGLLARDGSDPLLVATALHIAEKVGDHDSAQRAREVLTALGRKSAASVE